MAHPINRARAEALSLPPRGLVIAGFAMLSWAFVILGFNAMSSAFTFIIGA
ncbi:hypothetical protein [Devosia sp. CAU 1758]